jgi:hypothetical protein
MKEGCRQEGYEAKVMKNAYVLERQSRKIAAEIFS